MKKYLILLGFCLIPSLIYAGVVQDLDAFFERVGYLSKTSDKKAYESQASGAFCGGSLQTKTPDRAYQLVTLDLPDFRTGCSGIDLFTGSLSYISGEKLVNLGKQIMTNGGTYAVDVMLATTVPELKQVRDFLQTTVQKINQTSINSCEMAQNLVGGMWPKTVASQQKVCKDQQLIAHSGLGHDYVAAHMACSGGGFQDAIEKASTDDKLKQEVVLGKNFIWSMLKDNKILSADQELSELVMSLIGSIIIDKEGKITEVPSMANNTDLINALLGTTGAHDTLLWHCDEPVACLHVSQKTITIPEEHALGGHIRNLIQSINVKLKTNVVLTAIEKGFLEMTSLPVMKFLLVLNSTNYAHAAGEIDAYATLIASDLLQHYLSQLLQSVSLITQSGALNDDILRELRNRIDVANQEIARIVPHINQKLTEKLALIQQISQIEKQLAASLHA